MQCRSGVCRAGAGVLLAALASGTASAQNTTVPFFHNTADHAGLFTVPGLTAQTVAGTTPDTAFNGAVVGVINAAPLYWHPARAAAGAVIVATENNSVAALDETTGLPVWSVTLGTPAVPSSGCGNINPIGVTGTPVIDERSATLYVDAYIGGAGGPRNMLYAVSLATGAILPGWPVAVGAGVRALGQDFNENIEEQRGALSLLKGKIYIPFGGYNGDCGHYRGIVAGVTTSGAVAHAWSTSAEKGGIWAPSGVLSDGSSLFVATGNTKHATQWGGGEAVVHLTPRLNQVRSDADFFTPLNWRTLDEDDQDLGGTAPTLVTLPGASPSDLALALGKDGDAYLLNRDSLGGISNALQTLPVSSSAIRSATAVYPLGGAVMVAMNAQSPNCSGGSSGAGVLVLSITAAPAPTVAEAWCAPLSGRGNPVVTTSDGTHDPIVWITGAEGDEELHAYAGDTGALLYSSAPIDSTVAHFSTVLVANKRLFVPATNKVVAFTLGQ